LSFRIISEGYKLAQKIIHTCKKICTDVGREKRGRRRKRKRKRGTQIW
jgi:hypothetical protein